MTLRPCTIPPPTPTLPFRPSQPQQPASNNVYLNGYDDYSSRPNIFLNLSKLSLWLAWGHFERIVPKDCHVLPNKQSEASFTRDTSYLLACSCMRGSFFFPFFSFYFFIYFLFFFFLYRKTFSLKNSYTVHFASDLCGYSSDSFFSLCLFFLFCFVRNLFTRISNENVRYL